MRRSLLYASLTFVIWFLTFLVSNSLTREAPTGD